MRPFILLLVVLGAVAPAMQGREFEQDRATPPPRSLFKPPDRPTSAGSFGFSWSLEFRGCDQPESMLFGLGLDGMIRLHDRLWLDMGVSYLIGTSSEAPLSYRPGHGSQYVTRQVHGFEFRGWAQYRFAQWRSNSSYLMGGPSLGYYTDLVDDGHRIQDTVSLGPSLFLGIELGRRVRAAFDTGLTLPFALNHGDAGWMESHRDNGAFGYHLTFIRISVRWYARP